MTRRFLLALLAAFGLLCLAAPVQAGSEPIGTVSRVQNRAVASSAAFGERVLKSGDSVYRDDRVTTGDDARLEITFVDQTSLTLGADAAYEMSEFSFDGSQGAMTLDILSGTFAFTTGIIGRTDHGDVLVTTPVSTIGIRGTKFWGGPIDDAYGVLVLDGAVEVTTRGGSVALDRVGLGTRIVDAAAAPDAPKQWGADKKARALATVAFAGD